MDFKNNNKAWEYIIDQNKDFVITIDELKEELTDSKQIIEDYEKYDERLRYLRGMVKNEFEMSKYLENAIKQFNRKSDFVTDSINKNKSNFLFIYFIKIIIILFILYQDNIYIQALYIIYCAILCSTIQSELKIFDSLRDFKNDSLIRTDLNKYKELRKNQNFIDELIDRV